MEFNGMFDSMLRTWLSIGLMGALLGFGPYGPQFAFADSPASEESYSFLNLEREDRVRDFVLSEVDLIDSLSLILEGTTERSLLLILGTPCLEGLKSSEIIVNMPDGVIATGPGGILIYESKDDLRCSIRYIFDMPNGDRLGKKARKVKSHHKKLRRANR
jgi:hypothetical protein